ncbi:Ku protein [Streptomyces sp. NPDC002055]|uniref:non-homologous end joining protein Ku n=1 Tax=Streptomyces sp. NPDC002055 TaxID=3154534 RepID=UPI00331A3DBB
MPRPIWRGAISFGLVTIPVQVVSATESHDIALHRVHAKDNGRIRNRKVCELDGNVVPGEEIASAYPVSRDEVVPLTDEDFDHLPIPTAKTFELLAFLPSQEIDPLQLDRAYYLRADGQAAAKPYVLLRDALERSGKVAVGKVALRGKEVLALIRIHEGALTMHTMLWPDEIRPHTGLAPDQDIRLTDEELQRAEDLMASMSEVPEEELHDDYTDALVRVVSAKLEGREVEPPPATEAPSAQVVDLMAALEESVRKSRRSRGEEPSEPGARKQSGGTAKPSARKTAKAATKTATTTAAKTATKTATKTTTGTSSKPASASASTPGSRKTGNQAAKKTASKAASKTASKAAAPTPAKKTASRTRKGA